MEQRDRRADRLSLLTIGQVVAELQERYPDVTHSSLRFFEREGLIRATRTPGGHRLYSPDDVDRIRQIKAWQAQRLTLDAIRERLARLDRLPSTPWLAQEFLRLALSGDYVAAARFVIGLDEVGVPLSRILGDVLRPALIEVGRRWEQGDLLVAQEKEISQCVRDVIAELALRHSPDTATRPPIVAACVRGERHELGLYMICALLRASGRLVNYLGPDVEPAFLLDAVSLHRPAAVLLSAKLPASLPAAHEAIAALHAGFAPGPLPLVAIGGEAAIEHVDLVRSWGAVPVADTHPEKARQTIEALLRQRDPEADAR